jgi:hypothetical protein
MYFRTLLQVPVVAATRLQAAQSRVSTYLMIGQRRQLRSRIQDVRSSSQTILQSSFAHVFPCSNTRLLPISASQQSPEAIIA